MSLAAGQSRGKAAHMPVAKRKTEGVRWISRKEMDSIVAKRARAVLNVSTATFLRNRNAGKYKKMDADDCPGIVELAIIAPSPKASARGRKDS
jgi:hypothetical protein